MIEYAITAGEGTLLAYGVADWIDVTPFEYVIEDSRLQKTVIFDIGGHIIARPCTDDCETGK